MTTNLEMKRCKGRNEATKILGEIVELEKTVRIAALFGIVGTANLAGHERDVRVSADNLQFLFAILIWHGPICIISSVYKRQEEREKEYRHSRYSQTPRKGEDDCWKAKEQTQGCHSHR